MNESNDLLEGHNDSIGNRDTPLELALTLQTMAYLWTQYALDHLMVDLLFAHGLSSLFLLATTPSFILPSVTVRMYCPHGLQRETTHQMKTRSAETLQLTF